MNNSIFKNLKGKMWRTWKKHGSEIAYMAVMATAVGIIPDIASATSTAGTAATGFEVLSTPLSKGLNFVQTGVGPVLLAGGVGKAAYQHFTEQQNQGYKGAIALGIGGAGCLNADTIVNGVFGASVGCVFF